MVVASKVFEKVLQPINVARGLPNECYVDHEQFEREQEALFFSNWAALAFGKDVAEKGDAAPIEFLGQPLLLLRDREGRVRVFHNTCRHRGMILVNEARNISGAIRCPYHSWCYDLDGSLKATPHVGGPGQNTHDDVDRSTLGLVEVRSHVWQDVVFVNIDGKAEDFETANQDLLSRWEEFEQPCYFGGEDSEFELTVKSNWKLAVENYCESYHLPWVHPGLNSYSKLEDHYHIVSEGSYAGQGTQVYSPNLPQDQVFSDFEALSQKWDRSAEYVALFPNVLLGVHRDHRYAIILVPDGVETTTERVAIYYADEKMSSPDFADLRTKNAELWKEIFAEDIFVVEGMQAGRHGKGFDGGKFSPAMDEPTWAFHQWAANQLKSP